MIHRCVFRGHFASIGLTSIFAMLLIVACSTDPQNVAQPEDTYSESIAAMRALESYAVVTSFGSGTVQVIRPDRLRVLDQNGDVSAMQFEDGLTIILGRNQDGRWWRAPGDGSGAIDLISRLPDTLIRASKRELSDADGKVAVDGFAPVTRSAETPETIGDILAWNRFVIDSEKKHILSWSVSPSGTSQDEVLELTDSELGDMVSDIQLRPADRYEFSEFNQIPEFSMPVRVFAGVFGISPADQAVNVPVDSPIEFILTQPVEFMDLSISPGAELMPPDEERVDERLVRVVYEPETMLRPDVNYSVTFQWGASSSDKQSLTWSFTTAL